MADFPHITDWQGWLAKNKYAYLDPFERPIPAPVAGIFDNSDGDLRTVCFNPAWSPIITGALSRLEYPELYLSDGYDTVQDVRKLINIIAGIGDNPCVPQSVQTTECFYYPSWFAGIEYVNYNPFVEGDLPNGYNVAPFFRFGRINTFFPDYIDDFFQGAIENVTGYLENDIFVSYLSLPTLTNPFDGLDYPTIKLTVQGTGIVRLKLLSVPFGGRALISLDPPDITDLFSAVFTKQDRIVELNRDIFASVPETDIDEIEEIIFTEDGTHEIYITYLFVINDETPLLQMGGGFRGYEVCGNLTVIDATTGQPVDNTSENNTQEGVIVTTYLDVLRALNAHRTLDSQAWLLSLDEDGGITLDADTFNQSASIDPTTGETTKQATTGTVSYNPPTGTTTEQVLYGQAYGVGVGFRDLIADTMNWYITLALPLTSTVERMMRLFGFSETTIGITDYTLTQLYTAINPLIANATDTVTPTVIPDAIADIVYCAGANKASLYQYTYDLEDAGGTDAVDIATFYRAVIDELSEAQITEWYNAGASTPREGYQDTGCYRFPDQSWTLLDSNFNGNIINQTISTINAIQNRLLFVRPTGLMTSVEGNTWDGFYQVVNDVITYKPIQLFQFGGSVFSPIKQPSYKASQGYASAQYSVNTWSRWRLSSNVSGSGWTGSITFELIDGGSNA